MKQSPAIATAALISILQLATCDSSNSPSSSGQQQEQQQQAKGLQCYVCNSAQDPRCGDPFNPKTIELVNCNQFKPEVNSTVCRKNYQTVSLGNRVDVRVVRTCGYETALKTDTTLEEEEEAAGKSVAVGEERCYKRAGTFEVMVTYCTCKTNACNVAATPTPLSPLTTTLSMLASSLILFATSNTIRSFN